MTTEMMNCRPTTHILESLTAKNLGTRRAVMEVVDNSCGAGATLVNVWFGDGCFRITDNGCGVKNFQALLRLGDSQKSTSQSNSWYGLGMKAAVGSLIGSMREEIIVSTETKKGARKVRLNFRELTPDWELPLYDLPTETTGRTGTEIELHGLKKLPDIHKLAGELAYFYWPFLEASRTSIQLETPKKVIKLAPFRQPLLTGAIDVEITVRGQSVRVRAGIVPDTELNPRPGLTYRAWPRVVRSNGNAGAAGYDISRFFGFVDLPNTWKLSEHKDLLEDEDELFDAVQDACEPVLKKASQAAAVIQNDALISEMEARLSAALNVPLKDKAKRSKGSSHGSVTPTGGGSKHEQAEKRQDGKTLRSCRVRAATIIWGKSSTDDRIRGRGCVELAQGRLTITLNEDHPPLAEARISRPEVVEEAVIGLVSAWQAEDYESKQRKNLALYGDVPNGLCDRVSYFAARLDLGKRVESAKPLLRAVK